MNSFQHDVMGENELPVEFRRRSLELAVIWRFMGNKWCRIFHRRHQVMSVMDSCRTKISCLRCEKIFIREKMPW